MYLRIDKLRGSVSGGQYDGCFKMKSFQWGSGLAVSNARKRGISFSM
jgi:hypothetical protein